MRTAPAPNIPPIPGMNPCTWLAAGGAGGGGAGAGRGSAGSGDANASGGDGKADPADGGKNAASCGSGANDGGGCPNHHGPGSSGGMSRGDPVDVVTGRVFTPPLVELSFPGPLPLRIERSYSSSNHTRDIGLGPGWTHSLAWQVIESRRSVTVASFDGVTYDFGNVTASEATLGAHGWLLHREGEGFRLDLPNRRRMLFQHRTASAGVVVYQLSSIGDEWGNRIELRYERGQLLSVTDSVDRVVRMIREPSGRIATIQAVAGPEGHSLDFARYTYDAEGRLIAAYDADGSATRYTYDDRNLLTSHTVATGLTFFFRYDSQSRCVETWGQYPGGNDPSLAEDVPTVLADGTTRARGIFHVKLDYPMDLYSEATDSVAVHTYEGTSQGLVAAAVTPLGGFKRAYDDRGFLISFTDALGATTTWERDALGRETQVVDPLGRTTRTVRNDEGSILEIIGPEDDRTRLEYTNDSLSWTDAIGADYTVRFDSRGQPIRMSWPDGRSQTLTRDFHGNVIEHVDERGLRTLAIYDHWGRCLETSDATGRKTRFSYSNTDRLLSIMRSDGSTEHTVYDEVGNPVSTTDANGQTTRMVYGGFNRPVRIEKPNGEVIELRYNREGWLSYVMNARGLRHTFTRDAAGLIVQERSFDGRVVRYSYDAVGRVIGTRNAIGELTEYERDAAGQLIARHYSDGTSETFRYDGLGRIIEAECAAGHFRFGRNKRGWIVREDQSVEGKNFSVRTDYSATGDVIGRHTSLGHAAQWRRDFQHHRVELVLDGETSVHHEDLLGRESQRVLARGAILDFTRDTFGRLTATRVSVPGATSSGPTPPEWVGAFPPGTLRLEGFSYSPDGLLSERWNGHQQSMQYSYDPAGQLTGVARAGREVATYRYDPCGNRFDGTPGAPVLAYDGGDRLERNGPRTYLWDFDSRLREERTSSASGELEVRRYHWSANGRLAAVDLPNGLTVSFEYDPFGRRVKKQVARRETDESLRIVETTRFVWDGGALVHELVQRPEAGLDSLDRETTFVFKPGSTIPIAHRSTQTVNGARVDSHWWHYLNDDAGTPSALVAPDGRVGAELAIDVWGNGAENSAVRTPIRFRGQYADEETGLHYNRNRYYDPAVGRYISADPLGLAGGLNPFAYAGNCPTSAIDPEGLMFSVIKDASGKPVFFGHNLSEGGGVGDDAMHPALRAAGARGSCSETTALNGLANSLGPNATKEDIAKHFNEQGYTMETYEGNKADYDKGVKIGANPCSACGKMLNEGLGITQGVMAPNTSRDKGKMKPWDGSSQYTPVSKAQMADARRNRRR
jgi:RHS repeat-associated protein